MILVNGEAIDPALVNEAFARIKSEAEGRLKVSCCERNGEFTEQAEEEVIDSILIAQDVETRYADIPEEDITPRLETVFRQYREAGASWEMLEKQRETLREEICADLRMTHFMDDLIGEEKELTQDAYQAFYQEHRLEFAQPPRAKCQHICFFPQNHDDLGALVRHVREVRKRALAGEDFKELALEFTEKEKKDIYIDWVDLEDAMHPFEALLFSLNKGEVSPALSYDQAYHLIKVTDAVEAEISSFEDVQDQIKQMANAAHRKEKLTARARELRKTAEIRKEPPAEKHA